MTHRQRWYTNRHWW